jgi:hypothetical protein
LKEKSSPERGFFSGGKMSIENNPYRWENILKREPNPERFLRLFESVSQMRSLKDLQTEEYQESIWRRDLIRGAIIVGSASHPQSTPKDLDVVLVVNGSTGHTQESIEEMRYNFDMTYSIQTTPDPSYLLPVQHGRIDVLGTILLGEEELDPLYSEVIRRAGEPIIYAYDRKTAEEIKSAVDVIREEGKV